MSSSSEKGAFLRKLAEGLDELDISEVDSLLCAVSGGPDSTALLLGMLQLRSTHKTITAAHFNHRARDHESDADETFVRQMCATHEITLHVDSAQSVQQNLDENSARNERYAFLAKTADHIDADAIVVAHTVEDQAETVLLHITRGSGLRGASGMQQSRSIELPSGRTIHVVRPMLKINRSDVTDFLASSSVLPRHDSSNDDWQRYARNRIRHRVVPELQTLNPGAVEAIAHFGEIVQSNVELVDTLAEKAMQSACVNAPNVFLREPIAALHPAVQAVLLAQVFNSLVDKPKQLNRRHIAKLSTLIATGKSASFNLPGAIIFRSDHQHIYFCQRNESGDKTGDYLVPYPSSISGTKQLPIPGSIDLGDGYQMEATLTAAPGDAKLTEPGIVWLTPELARANHLIIRNRESSDLFNPIGMRQDVKLTDFLIKAKVPASWRDRIPLVVSPINNRIAWIPSVRPSDWAKSSPQHCEALRLRLARGTSAAPADEQTSP